MTLWCCKGGRNGEYEGGMLEDGYIGKGGAKLGDLSGFQTRGELSEHYRRHNPDANAYQVGMQVGQLWRILNEMEIGELVVLPQKTQSQIAIGTITGPYAFREDVGLHTRAVRWVAALMAICQITRNNAEARVKHVLETGEDNLIPLINTGSGGEAPFDIEQAARDQVMKFISRRFVGHDFTRLIEAILNAQGFTTERANPGPDQGIDVLAGSGSMGLDKPWMCVQVKSGNQQADVAVLRALQGSMGNFSADRGLLVSWGGFTGAARREARSAFFKVRLWDAANVVGALTKYYEHLPDSVQAEIPLKRIWALAAEEEQEE